MTSLYKYLLFAVLATVANLLTQEFTIQIFGSTAIASSILLGTIVGFISKYVCDKFWVFDDKFVDEKSEIRKIAFYGGFSVITTLIFWSVEVGFYTIFQSNIAKYIGAVLGLAIGYVLKFLLDRRYVFTERKS